MRYISHRKKKMVAGNGLFYPILGFASFVAFIFMSFGDFRLSFNEEPKWDFVKRNGTQFVLDGKAFYVNGWNSYWFMDHAVDDFTRPRVGAMLQTGAKMGLTVCRTWAFNDGTYNALQISPGKFNEKVFQVLKIYCFSILCPICCFSIIIWQFLSVRR